MNSSLYIDGVALWAFGFIVFFFLFISIIIGCSYLKNEKENYYLKRKINKLNAELNLIKNQLYVRDFSVPNIDKDYHDVFSKNELGGEKNV